MAGLGCGSYRFSNCVNNNKSYVYLKLTESAHNALEEYLKIRNCSKSQPSIAFNGAEGEFRIPRQNHGAAMFKFQMQKAQDAEGPQGSFESIRQTDSSHSLDSLGPLLNIMRIQATDDSYEKTRQSMANAMAQNGKTCVKELKTNGVLNRHRPTRPSSLVVPPHKKEPSNFSSNPYSSQNGNTTSSSPHRSSSGKPNRAAPPARLPPPQLTKKNEALKRKPLRERIIHLLALMPMKKLQLMQRINAEGVKESDKRHISHVLQNVASLKENAYHLFKHLWSEVNEEWPFYSEEEKVMLQRNKPQSLSPHDRDAHSSHSSPSLSPSSLGAVPDPLKRSRDASQYDPTVKKPRFASDSRFVDSSARSGSYTSSSSGGAPLGEGSPRHDVGLRDTRRSKWPPPGNRDERRPSETLPNDVGSVNGHHSPSSNSVSPLSQNDSPPRHPPFSTTKPQDAPSLSNGFASHTDSASKHAFTNSRSDKNSSSRNHHNSPVNGVQQHVQSSSPASSSPDSQQENDNLKNYKKQYSKIENEEQRRRYKADFEKIYKDYKSLHHDLEKTMLFFQDLNASLIQQRSGTPEYEKIRQRICDEYTSHGSTFNDKKKRYHHLDEVLKHIKRHVHDYDGLN